MEIIIDAILHLLLFVVRKKDVSKLYVLGVQSGPSSLFAVCKRVHSVISERYHIT